jgi:hypothetical protein
MRIMAAKRRTAAKAAGKSEAKKPGGSQRRKVVLATAKYAGLLAGESNRIAARIRKPLIEAARAQSGIESDTELLEYALACVALEDDFGEKFLALKGTVPKDMDLEF